MKPAAFKNYHSTKLNDQISISLRFRGQTDLNIHVLSGTLASDLILITWLCLKQWGCSCEQIMSEWEHLAGSSCSCEEWILHEEKQKLPTGIWPPSLSCWRENKMKYKPSPPLQCFLSTPHIILTVIAFHNSSHGQLKVNSYMSVVSTLLWSSVCTVWSVTGCVWCTHENSFRQPCSSLWCRKVTICFPPCMLELHFAACVFTLTHLLTFTVSPPTQR